MSEWYLKAAKNIDAVMQKKAEAYQLTLTKPPGALGQLEVLATQFSAYQSTLKPRIKNIDIVIMAGDHGVADEGVSAFPQAVTAEMVKNFATGGAAIAVLARQLFAELNVVNVGTVSHISDIDGVLDRRIAAGTANFCEQAAMTQEQLKSALLVGQELVINAMMNQAQLLIGGEMGIANTTAAACIAARLLDKTPEQMAGPGTGLNGEQVQHKAQVIQRALTLHSVKQPIEILQTFGGFEIAALVGLTIAAAQAGIPVLLDGYISTAAALLAVKINPSIKPWLIASHCSAEPAHRMMLEALALQPLLDIGMRLGEGSGAAVAVPLLQAACLLQSEMASFAEAGVSEKSA
jgi:nicotinate-nucleotide--dimethylbenzimidazole phosphoribosyltransferase